MEKRYKEIDGVRYQVIQNTILGSNVVPVGETLPEVTVSDSGKVLAVNSSGEWDAAAVPGELPAVAGNAGKVLKVNAGATGTEWANETAELPAVTSADEGDVLTVNASGHWAKAAPSGGMTLYGPYFATVGSAQTIPADGTSHVINLTAIYDPGSLNQVELPSLPVKYTLCGFSFGSTDLLNVGVYTPGYFAGEIRQPVMIFFNKSESPVTVSSETVHVDFYSDTELQQATP